MLGHTDRQRDRQTDRETDRQTDGWTLYSSTDPAQHTMPISYCAAAVLLS